LDWAVATESSVSPSIFYRDTTSLVLVDRAGRRIN
jgi:hypothetical protein